VGGDTKELLKVIEGHVGKAPMPKEEFLLSRGDVLVGFISNGKIAQSASVTLTLALFAR
jgi:hypothetical protein